MRKMVVSRELAESFRDVQEPMLVCDESGGVLGAFSLEEREEPPTNSSYPNTRIVVGPEFTKQFGDVGDSVFLFDESGTVLGVLAPMAPGAKPGDFWVPNWTPEELEAMRNENGPYYTTEQVLELLRNETDD